GAELLAALEGELALAVDRQVAGIGAAGDVDAGGIDGDAARNIFFRAAQVSGEDERRIDHQRIAAVPGRDGKRHAAASQTERCVDGPAAAIDHLISDRLAPGEFAGWQRDAQIAGGIEAGLYRGIEAKRELRRIRAR